MAQYDVWEREYRNSQLLTKENKPQNDVVRFVKFLKKEAGLNIEDLSVLDIGSGAGRNTNYFSTLDAKATGLEISDTAINIAKRYAHDMSVAPTFIKHDIGQVYPLEDQSFDIALDITSSNSLDEKGREIYLKEVSRVLKSGGYFFVRALCKDGDSNAKNLLKINPGKEKDTYVMKELGLTERVFSKDDFMATYSQYFDIVSVEKKSGYARMNNRSYKRNYWLAIMKKK